MKSNISRSDIISVIILFSILIPLGIWGGSKRWAAEADYVPFFIMPAIALYLIVQGFRLGSPKFGALVGGMVFLAIFIPSVLFDLSRISLEKDIMPAMVVLLFCIAFGAGVAAIGKKFDTPQKLRAMDKTIKTRIWGICFFPIGIILFVIGYQVPRGLPLGLLAWFLQLLGVYISVFQGIVKVIRGK